MERQKAIYFDMDGTIANLYAVEGWLRKLRASNVTPYAEARVMWNMSDLARTLNKLQKQGYTLGIISWLSKGATAEYGAQVTEAKKQWLSVHLKSVRFDEVHIVEYGAPKAQIAHSPHGILFDDEYNNRLHWRGDAYDEKNILKILKKLLKNS